MKVKCEAQNALTAIACILFDKMEKMYSNFLFKNVWTDIVNINEKWVFPLDFAKDELPIKRQEIVAIRKAGISKENTTSFKPHFLADSSLSQEVTSFDFNDSIMSVDIQSSNGTSKTTEYRQDSSIR